MCPQTKKQFRFKFPIGIHPLFYAFKFTLKTDFVTVGPIIVSICFLQIRPLGCRCTIVGSLNQPNVGELENKRRILWEMKVYMATMNAIDILSVLVYQS